MCCCPASNIVAHPAWQGDTLFFHARGGGCHAQGVPQRKGAKFPSETPLHGAVNIDKARGDFGVTSGGVGKGAGKRMPNQLAQRDRAGRPKRGRRAGKGSRCNASTSGQVGFCGGQVDDLARARRG